MLSARPWRLLLGGFLPPAHLERAGLIASRRESRSIIYTANFEGLAPGGVPDARLLPGHPEICAPAAALANQCNPAQKETACAC